MNCRCNKARHLVAEDLDKHERAIVKNYHQAQQRAGSPRQFRSVLDQIEFLIGILSDPDVSRPAAKQVPVLRRILGQPGP